MAGGTSRKDHSEVGSSYIHFNYTPDGNKTTPSLFGDVPRGVMLNQPAIFLGGQGGVVGPSRLGYGTVVAAGSVVRDDVPEDKKLVIARAHPGAVKDFIAHAYKNLSRIIGNNVIYLANLAALEQWYRHVRQPFFKQQEFGTLIFAGAMEKLTMAKTERLTRLRALVERVPAGNAAGQNLRENIDRVCSLFQTESQDNGMGTVRDRFLAGFQESSGGAAQDYIKAIQSLPPAVAREGTAWLQQIIDITCSRAASVLTALDMFRPHGN
jgi:UDP-N-acetylglucosamine/UDP-N-acetylgalactosamine diphosphorylase